MLVVLLGLQLQGSLVVRLPVEVAVEGAIVELACDGAEQLPAQCLATVLIATSLCAGGLPQELLQPWLRPLTDVRPATDPFINTPASAVDFWCPGRNTLRRCG